MLCKNSIARITATGCWVFVVFDRCPDLVNHGSLGTWLQWESSFKPTSLNAESKHIHSQLPWLSLLTFTLPKAIPYSRERVDVDNPEHSKGKKAERYDKIRRQFSQSARGLLIISCSLCFPTRLP